MGMSTYVKGFMAPDETWNLMKAIWDACNAAGVRTPDPVLKFFGYDYPFGQGKEVDLQKTDCCKKYSAESTSGFEIDVTKLPEGVKIVRFYNSW